MIRIEFHDAVEFANLLQDRMTELVDNQSVGSPSPTKMPKESKLHQREDVLTELVINSDQLKSALLEVNLKRREFLHAFNNLMRQDMCQWIYYSRPMAIRHVDFSGASLLEKMKRDYKNKVQSEIKKRRDELELLQEEQEEFIRNCEQLSPMKSDQVDQDLQFILTRKNSPGKKQSDTLEETERQLIPKPEPVQYNPKQLNSFYSHCVSGG